MMILLICREIFLDLVMPKFVGKKTLKKMIEIDRNANVIICSSLGSEAGIEFCLRTGAHFYLQKPYELDGVTTALASLPQKLLSLQH